MHEENQAIKDRQRTIQALHRIVHPPAPDPVRFTTGDDAFVVADGAAAQSLARERESAAGRIATHAPGAVSFPASDSIMVRTYALPKEVPTHLRFEDNLLRFYGLDPSAIGGDFLWGVYGTESMGRAKLLCGD